MDRILTYTIKPEQEGMQLLDFLRSKGFSRGILSSMKADKNAIQLNGERGFVKSILQAGDSLHIHIPEADNTENILPVRMDLSILYEDEDILVEVEDLLDESEEREEEAEERADNAEAELEQEKKKAATTSKPVSNPKVKSKSGKSTPKSTGTTSPTRKSRQPRSSTTTGS